MGSDEALLLTSVVGRIVPSDHDPGALDLGTANFVLRHLADDNILAAAVRQGLANLDAVALARFGTPFSAIAIEQQDALLQTIQHSSWFADLAELTAEGFYADPANGGNEGALSWRMIGYEHRLPDGPNGPTQPQSKQTDEQ